MVRKTIRLLILGGVLGALPVAYAAAQAEPYCCVCTACPTGAVQCVTVQAAGISTAGCATACSGIGCGGAKVVEGACPAPAACASLLGAPAPALSWQALAALALALSAWGVYRTQRRMRA